LDKSNQRSKFEV